MKKVFLTLLIICVSFHTNAQIVSVADGSSISIAQGSSVTVGGLKLAPDQTYVIEGYNTISRTLSSVSIGENVSVSRVYSTENMLNNYSGTIVFFYSDDELNGMNEEDLVIELRSSDEQWTSYESANNPDSNTLTYTFSDASFNAVTASDNGNPMSIDSPEAEFLVKAYPNPTRDFININSSEVKSAVLYDLQGRVIFKATDVTFGFLGDDSDSDSGFYLERQDDGSYDAAKGGQNRQNMNAQNEQAMSSFIQPKQVVGKSYVRFLNSTSSPLTGSGTFKIAPLYDSDGDGSFGNRSRRTNMTVTGNIADSDGTLALQGNEGFANFDSDGFTIGSTKVSIPSKYNLTVINAAGSTVATFQFLDPS